MPNETRVLNVDGMSCGHCENAVVTALGALKGVDNVKVCLKEKKVTIDFDSDKVSMETIKAAIEEEGYNVV